MSKAIVPLVIGLVILIAASFLAVWNEQRAANAMDLQRAEQADVVDAATNGAPADLEGEIVHVTGSVTATGKATDRILGQSFAVLRLDRSVETAQWREEKIITQGGRDVVYRLVWAAERIDSSRFRDGGGAHPNPPLRLTSASFLAPGLHLGGWTADPSTWQMLPATISLDLHEPMALEEFGRLKHHGNWWWSGSPERPSPGDVRLRLSAVPLGIVSLIGKAVSQQIEALIDRSGRRLALAMPDAATSQDMLGQAAERSAFENWKGRAFALTGFLLGGYILAFALAKLGMLGRFGTGIPAAGSLIGPTLWLVVSAGAWLLVRAG